MSRPPGVESVLLWWRCPCHSSDTILCHPCTGLYLHVTLELDPLGRCVLVKEHLSPWYWLSCVCSLAFRYRGLTCCHTWENLRGWVARENVTGWVVGVGVRRRRFELQSHPRWRIVEISSRPPNLSAKQSKLTVRTKKPSAKEKAYQLRKKPIS